MQLPFRRQPSPPEVTLRQLREDGGFSQSQVANELGISQAAVLKTESAWDPRISTVRKYVEAVASLGRQPGCLRLVAMIGESATTILLPDEMSPGTVELRREKQLEVTHIGEVPSSTETGVAWRLRAWNDPDLEAIWFDRNIMSISADEVGDLTTWPGDEALSLRLRAAFPGRPQQAIGTFVTYWRYFRIEIVPNDVVVVPLSDRRAGVARVIGSYDYNAADLEPRLRHRRTVEWLHTIQRDELDDDIRKVVNAPGTICRIGAQDAARRLR